MAYMNAKHLKKFLLSNIESVVTRRDVFLRQVGEKLHSKQEVAIPYDS